jgi:hypothetical protein
MPPQKMEILTDYCWQLKRKTPDAYKMKSSGIYS